MRAKCFLFILLIISLPVLAAEKSPDLFAPEFEFSRFSYFKRQAKEVVSNALHSDEVLKKTYHWEATSEYGHQLLTEISDAYKAEAKKTKYFQVEVYDLADESGVHSFKINYPKKDFYFEVTVDPGVIEVKAKPESLQRWTELAPLLERDLFTFFKVQGLTPGWIMGFGAGHLNFSGSRFQNDLLLLRNFLVDYVNHSEMALGVHYGMVDKFNARPIAADAKQYEAFKKLIRKVDEGKIKTAAQLGVLFNDEVYEIYTKKDIESVSGLEQLRRQTPGKFASVRIHMSDSKKTIKRLEIRAMRQQNSMDDFILFSGLFDSRIELIRTVKTKIQLLDLEAIRDRSTFVKRYRQYVEETGLDWTPYNQRIPFVLKCESAFWNIF